MRSDTGSYAGACGVLPPERRCANAGDAVLTVNINSPWDFLLRRQRVSGPPWMATWNWPMAKRSVAALAALEPRVLACGHPVTDPETASKLRAFSERFST